MALDRKLLITLTQDDVRYLLTPENYGSDGMMVMYTNNPAPFTPASKVVLYAKTGHLITYIIGECDLYSAIEAPLITIVQATRALPNYTDDALRKELGIKVGLDVANDEQLKEYEGLVGRIKALYIASPFKYPKVIRLRPTFKRIIGPRYFMELKAGDKLSTRINKVLKRQRQPDEKKKDTQADQQ